VQTSQIKEQLLEGCHRLAKKGFLNSPGDSFSLRIPGKREMLLLSKCEEWGKAEISDIQSAYFSSACPTAALHACIYEERGDAGGIAISSPKWARLLARAGEQVPPLFDEQVRHLGPSVGLVRESEPISGDAVKQVLRRGTNALLLGERLLSLGMTRDRVLFNAELYEKCAQAHTLAKACRTQVNRIPLWVRVIATRRLLKDEDTAAATYRDGRIPDGNSAY
jgi:ribulose-5-phosphate 4-epimerase/fuculose-1-phosphate aldolase